MSLYTTTLLSDAPIAYWRLGESSGSSAADSSGNARNGTYTGGCTLGMAGAIKGDNDPAVKLDGTAGYISFPALPRLTQWSVEAWIYPTGNQANDASVISDKYTVGSVNYVLGFNFSGSAPLGIFAGYFTGGSWYKTADFNIAANQWQHLVGTYDGANIRLFVNGVQQATVAAAPAPTTDSGGGYLGHRWDTASLFAGLIDECAIYNAPLSASRVLAHYAAGVSSGIAAPAVGTSLIRKT